MSYVPGTPIYGLSGVAGVGDLGVVGTQVGVPSGQGVLTNYSPEVNNTSAASVQRQITGKTYIDGSGSYTVLRFIEGAGGSGGYGLESDWLTGSGGFGHRVDARTTFGANYAYSSFIFLNNRSNGVPEPNFAARLRASSTPAMSAPSLSSAWPQGRSGPRSTCRAMRSL